MDNKRLKKAITGLFYPSLGDKMYTFYVGEEKIWVEQNTRLSINELVKNRAYPIQILQHSLGVDNSEEDYRNIPLEDYLSKDRRNLIKRLYSKSLKSFNFTGLEIPVPADHYVHAVGPIHAGIIEPGHFRFLVKGEEIQSLDIRLGFQKRGILEKLKGLSPFEAFHYIQTVSGDSSIAYSLSLSRLYENALNIEVEKHIQLSRLILLELERIAVHIGDLGAIAGDVAFYPLQAVGSTDRGIPLGITEALTGSRFGRNSLYPGEIRTKNKLSKLDLDKLVQRLVLLKKRISKHVRRAMKSTTFRERLQFCGTVHASTAYKKGFIGMLARSCGLRQDTRFSDYDYNLIKKLSLELDRGSLKGDAWSRFLIRYLEFMNSTEWLIHVLPYWDITNSQNVPNIYNRQYDIESKFYYGIAEGWRGSVITGFILDKNAKIKEAYIRDPSVLNWHGLELAVKGENIGDFPLNNKSFNLSYVGVDL